MSGEFGAYINEKRRGRGEDGGDILLRDLAAAMGGVSLSYLSDILKGRRNPPDLKQLRAMARALSLSPEEEEKMLDLAGEERQETPPDLPGYILDRDLPYVRVALRTARRKGLGNEYWKKIVREMEEEDGKGEAP